MNAHNEQQPAAAQEAVAWAVYGQSDEWPEPLLLADYVVPMSNWRLIEKPEFPLSTDRSGYRDWGPHLEYLPSDQANSHGAGVA